MISVKFWGVSTLLRVIVRDFSYSRIPGILKTIFVFRYEEFIEGAMVMLVGCLLMRDGTKVEGDEMRLFEPWQAVWS